jgi:hypothetical protein
VASGSEVTASLIGGRGVQASGDSSGAKVGAFSSVAAPTAQQTSKDADKTVTEKKANTDEEEEKKKRASSGPVISKTTGRVTVILPTK